MKAVVLRVRAENAEAALDRLLPRTPVYERTRGPFAELVVCGELPQVELGAALLSTAELEVPDDPQQRFAALVDVPVIAGRFVVRSPVGPPPAEGLIDVVIDRGAAFGSGLHPTTQRCLEHLLTLRPTGSFADLGCGTGVLSIAAAKLGWNPVTAVDYDAGSVASAAANADTNGVVLEARQVDLLHEPAPLAETVVANVPALVQRAVRATLVETPRALVLSGVTPGEADEVVASYADLGLIERARHVQSNWATVLLTRPEEDLLQAPEQRDVLRLPTPGEPPSAAGAPGDLPTELPGQLVSELPGGGLALSSAHELPAGARVAVLLAPGLFRLDVRHLEDTLKLSVRNLSGREIRSSSDDEAPPTVVTTSDLTLERPLATNARMRLRFGAGADAIDAAIVLNALSGGLVVDHARLAAQAIVGPAPGEPPVATLLRSR